MPNSAVVTGGANGIGKAICLELAERGYQVIVVDLSLEESLVVVDEIHERGKHASAIACDVTSEASVAAMVEAVVDLAGHADLVFSNAGAGVRSPVAEFSRKDLEWIFSLNVFGMWDVAAQFARRAISQGKPTHIVLTGSEHSIGLPHAGNAAYTATKHAILAAAECMRDEWAELPPSVSILCPGLTQSRFWEGDRHRGVDANKPSQAAAAVLSAGMPAEQLAKIAVDGAESKEFYLFTHPHAEAYAQARFREVSAGFLHLNQTYDATENYDVDSVINSLSSKKGDPAND